jgi:hypothetical protein
MSREVEGAIQILNANGADVAQNNATWYDLDGADQVVFAIRITGTANATLDFDPMGDETVSSNNTYTSSNTQVLDDPCGKVRAWSADVSANESSEVLMRKIYFNR